MSATGQPSYMTVLFPILRLLKYCSQCIYTAFVHIHIRVKLYCRIILEIVILFFDMYELMIIHKCTCTQYYCSITTTDIDLLLLCLTMQARTFEREISITFARLAWVKTTLHPQAIAYMCTNWTKPPSISFPQAQVRQTRYSTLL